MITVYGADWCDDTRRSLRLLRRLGAPHRYLNVDEDIDALARAKSLSDGRRHTPVIDLGMGGTPLVEPDNETLSGALVELEMLTADDVRERLSVQNVGDFERMLRAGVGIALIFAGGGVPRSARVPMRIAGAALALSGLAGWCPAYYAGRVTSIDGPGDRPDEALRQKWLAHQNVLEAPR